MIQIGDKLVSLDLFERKFVCHLDKCSGNCCVHGDSGAPLNEEETRILESEYTSFKNYISIKGNETIGTFGKWLYDADGDRVTPLIEGKECAYAVFENGIARCGIEIAWINGKTKFRKPVSCHLYPIRVSRVGEFTALNYHEWLICKPAIVFGSSLGVPLFAFLKDPIIRVFGDEFFKELEKVSLQIKN